MKRTNEEHINPIYWHSGVNQCWKKRLWEKGSGALLQSPTTPSDITEQMLTFSDCRFPYNSRLNPGFVDFKWFYLSLLSGLFRATDSVCLKNQEKCSWKRTLLNFLIETELSNEYSFINLLNNSPVFTDRTTHKLIKYIYILLKETTASALIIFFHTDSILRTTLLICGGKIKIISPKFISVQHLDPTWIIIRPKTEKNWNTPQRTWLYKPGRNQARCKGSQSIVEKGGCCPHQDNLFRSLCDPQIFFYIYIYYRTCTNNNGRDIVYK